MSQHHYFLPIILRLIAIGLIAFFSISLSPHMVYAAPQTSLSFSPQTATWNLNTPTTVDLMITSGTNKVVSTDIVVRYNPQVITGVDILPGSFLRAPSVIQKSINNTTGTMILSFYTSNTNARSGQGIFASLSFLPKTIGVSELTFDTSRTLVYSTDEGSSLSQTANGSYSVIQNSPSQTTPTVSPQSTMSLIVVDNDQKPLSNSPITVTDNTGRIQEVVTDDQGNITLSNINPGTTELTFTSMNENGETIASQLVSISQSQDKKVVTFDARPVERVSEFSGYLPLILGALVTIPVILGVIYLLIRIRHSSMGNRS